MLHNRIFFRGRWVDQITSEEGQRQYYDRFDCWRSCVANHNPLKKPTVDDAKEYLRLKSLTEQISCCRNIIEERRAYRKLKLYDTRYDWRPIKTGKDYIGLMAPDGTELLPEKYVDVFTDFDVYNNLPDFIPVFNGNAWGLVSSKNPSVMGTDFIYNAILPEHFEYHLYFVQDKETMKWGALHSMNKLTQLMPSVADEIYEDELMGDCDTSIFWMTRTGDKIGILTPYGYSKIDYDNYETDDERFRIRMKKGKEIKILDYSFFRNSEGV